MNAHAVIQIQKLTKVYGKVTAVRNLDFQVYAGEVFGLLGPNGAGKTTTIRVLTGLSRPSGGQVLVGGYDVVRQPMQAKMQLGVVQQHLSLDRELTVGETMELHGRLRAISAPERRRRSDELLDYVGLAEQGQRKVDQLSGGMKRRLMIARALLHSPRILLLDEPTVGLDPQTRRRIWELVRRLNDSGMTVLLTTHYIEEAEALCHRVGIVDHGALLVLDSPRTLRERLGTIAVEMLSDTDTRYRYFPDRAAASHFVETAMPPPRSIVIRDSNLEDVFIELTGRKVRE